MAKGQLSPPYCVDDASYDIWDDLPQIIGPLDQLGRADCVLVGHTRGANIAALFAAAQPETVRALVSLDSLVPNPFEEDVISTLRAFIEQHRKQMTRLPGSPATKGNYIRRRCDERNSRLRP